MFIYEAVWLLKLFCGDAQQQIRTVKLTDVACRVCRSILLQLRFNLVFTKPEQIAKRPLGVWERREYHLLASHHHHHHHHAASVWKLQSAASPRYIHSVAAVVPRPAVRGDFSSVSKNANEASLCSSRSLWIPLFLNDKKYILLSFLILQFCFLCL